MIDHELRAPRNDREWSEFHTIRRKVLFENRGKLETYDENHPDDAKPGNHPLVLLYQGTIVGVMRLDVTEKVAWLRRVAIREDLQRRGHGRALLQLAEEFAQAHGCTQIVSNAAVEAAGFYERCGYERDESACPPSNSIRVQKIIFSDPQKQL